MRSVFTEQDVLDDMIYEHYARLASDLNNQGPEAQKAFLLENGFTVRDIEQRLVEEEKGEDQ